MNRSWMYALSGWLVSVIAISWSLASPLSQSASQRVLSLFHENQQNEIYYEDLNSFIRKGLQGTVVAVIISSHIGFFCIFYFYQRRERKIHLLFKDFITSVSPSKSREIPFVKKTSHSRFPLYERKIEEVRDSDKKDEMRVLLSVLEEGIFIVNEKGEIDLVNQKALFSLGILAKEVKGRPLAEIFGLYPSPLSERCLEIFLEGFELKQEVRAHFEAGGDDKRFYELIAFPLSEPGKMAFLIQDHSSDHKMLTMGKNFVTNASHELRTPITIIEGFTETLQEIPEISQEMFKEITDKILNNCHRMASVVKSLLVLADLEYSGQATLQLCDLVALIESCSYTLLNRHSRVKIETLFNEKESLVLGDPDLLELAFINLFENAVKYSADPAFITVTVETLTEVVNVSVRDRGIGIHAKDRAHVFERFYTVNKSRSRKLGGAGLGLSIVKMIMEKHNANISVAPAEDEGTVFTMQFQRAVVPQGV